MLLLSVRLVTGNNPWKSNILYMYRDSGGERESESVFGKEYVWVLAYNDISLPINDCCRLSSFKTFLWGSRTLSFHIPEG